MNLRTYPLDIQSCMLNIMSCKWYFVEIWKPNVTKFYKHFGPRCRSTDWRPTSRTLELCVTMLTGPSWLPGLSLFLVLVARNFRITFGSSLFIEIHIYIVFFFFYQAPILSRADGFLSLVGLLGPRPLPLLFFKTKGEAVRTRKPRYFVSWRDASRAFESFPPSTPPPPPPPTPLTWTSGSATSLVKQSQSLSVLWVLDF